MKRYIHAVAAAAILTSSLGTMGCADKSCVPLEDRYRNAVDVSWPDRYEFAARESVLAPFSQQASNGHFLEQSIWNWYFEPGTDKLTPGGIDRLDALSRKTPASDPRIYIQTARDIVVTADNADKIATLRDELDAKRAAAIKKYMASQPGTHMAVEVYRHDAPVPGMSANFAATAFRGQVRGYVGGLGGAQGTLVNAGGGGGQNAGGGATGPGGAPGGGTPGGTPGGAPGGTPGTTP